jgi:hypothetical protein
MVIDLTSFYSNNRCSIHVFTSDTIHTFIHLGLTGRCYSTPEVILGVLDGVCQIHFRKRTRMARNNVQIKMAKD